MNINLFILFFIHIITTQFCYSAKILAVIPFPAKSHQNFIRPILKELASRGHEITFYTAIPLQQNVTNINEIVVADPMKNSPLGKISFKMIRQIGSVPYLRPPALCFFGPVIMEEILSDKDMQKLIQSNDKYDLILAETHFFQEPLIGFGHKFQAPVVSLHTFSTYFYTNEFIGNPIGAAYLPGFELPYSDKMTFFQRVHNAIRTWINFIAAYTYYLPTQEKLMRKYFTYKGAEKMPPLVEMLQNVSLVVTNTQVSIDFPHPEVPTVINTAGLHISPKRQPLPQDLKKFMDDSKDGVIYFSFGSVVPSEELPDEMKRAFIKVFEKLKQNILWKLPVKQFPGLPKNVKLGSWFPQQDILAHPNCIAFITHGGLLSQIESVYFGVPLIGVPFMGEQSLNMNRAVQRGFAIYLNQYNITEESVSWAINEILTKPSYRDNVKKYSNIFRDNQNPPLEKAVYWIEYVIRHKGAAHLRTEGRTLPYYKYLLLDVILFISVSLLLILYIFYKIIALILSLVFGNKSKPKLKSNKKDN